MEVLGTKREAARVTREDIQQLHALMKHCFKHDGPYPLSSGRSSNYYYDGKLGTLHPPTAWLIGNILLGPILESRADAVGGLEIGSVPIADAIGIAAHLRGITLPTFVVRKVQKQHGTRSQIAQAYREDGKELLTKGVRVAIVDDVITTGGSIKQAIDVVQDLGCTVATVITLVERHESGDKALRGLGFPVLRVFYTNAEGQLFTDEEFVRRVEAAASRGALRA
jgi:orotate phosphoribosyltransferase